MAHMDTKEQVALDLDLQQQLRYKKAGCSDDFWDEDELAIFESIKQLRSESDTFHPLNER